MYMYMIFCKATRKSEYEEDLWLPPHFQFLHWRRFLGIELDLVSLLWARDFSSISPKQVTSRGNDDANEKQYKINVVRGFR